MASEHDHTAMERQRSHRERQRGGVVVRAIATPATKRMLARGRWCDIRDLDNPAAVAAALQRWIDAAAACGGSDRPDMIAAPDNLSKDGAERLGETVAGYWIALGYKASDVGVWLEKVKGSPAFNPAFGVRSDLVAGLPRRSSRNGRAVVRGYVATEDAATDKTPGASNDLPAGVPWLQAEPDMKESAR